MPCRLHEAEGGRARRGQGRSQDAFSDVKLLLPAPDADAVDLCVGKIHASNSCENFLRISRVTQLDTEVSAQEAIVTAEIEMKVLAPFAVCSPIASNCTGSMLGFAIGTAEANRATGPAKPPGRLAGQDREIVCVQEVEERRLAMRHAGAAPGRIRPRAGRDRSDTSAESICVDALQLLRRVWHANARLSFLFGGKKTRRIFSFAFRIARFD